MGARDGRARGIGGEFDVVPAFLAGAFAVNDFAHVSFYQIAFY
jgi:hypothetical protein